MIIYKISDDRLDDLLRCYRNYLTNPKALDRQSFDWSYQNLKSESELPRETQLISGRVELIQSDPQYIATRENFIVLLDRLFKISKSRYDGFIYLYTQKLRNHFKDYKLILDVLRYNLIIDKISTPTNGHDKIYYLIKDFSIFHKEETKNLAIIRKIKTIDSIYQELQDKKHDEIIKKLSSNFVHRFEQGLKCLTIKSELAIDYSSIKKNNEKSYQYYLNVIQKVNDKDYKVIKNVDDRNRLYHIGTMIPKLLRSFTNINYLIDCKNSQPLIFNYFILNHYFNYNNKDINKELQKLFYLIHEWLRKYDGKPSDIYKDRKELYKYLINNNIDDAKIGKVKKIKSDELIYILASSKGIFWDIMTDEAMKSGEFEITYDELRNLVKTQMLEEVFYSYDVNPPEENKSRLMVFFEKKFPNVHERIKRYKRELRVAINASIDDFQEGYEKFESNYKKSHLANIITKVESNIFNSALTTIYGKDKRIRCISIHDAIAIINDTVSIDIVKEILYEKYKEYGLIPTFSVEQP